MQPRTVEEIIGSVMNDEVEAKTYKEYFIVMADYDTFILKIYTKDRSNNMDNDDVIKEYMTNNYYGHSYEVIDRNSSCYDIVTID